jgi:hypothetical protein
MVIPKTSKPCLCSKAAATEESTPPLRPTATFAFLFFIINFSKADKPNRTITYNHEDHEEREE